MALETSGVFGPAAASFVQDLGRRITARTGERRDTAWLRQRLSLAIARGNSASVLATAPSGYNNNRQSNNSYRNDYSPGGSRGRGGWRKQPPSHSSGGKAYQHEGSQRWRSPPRRPPSPLRARENDSPLLRRPNQSPRRRDQSPSEAKRARLSHSAERGPIRPGKENSEGQLPSASTTRFGGESGGCRPAGQQMRPPRKADEGGTALYDGKAQAARKLQLIPAVRSPNPNKHGTDPLYVGLPNYGNSCYQNATLQSLLGLRPFLSEMMSLITDHEGDQCCTRAVAKLNAPTEGPHKSRHLNELRDVFADIDPAFRGTQMQDANEFLLRLLDAIKDEVDARRPAANPVRDNFSIRSSRATCAPGATRWC